MLFAAAVIPLLADEMWVELGPAPTGFTALARYTSRDIKSCPAISLDGREQPMLQRTNTGKFVAVVCEHEIPFRTISAVINGQALPVPAWTKKAHPVIVVIGDTGCRIKQGGEDSAGPGGKWNIQDCASSKDWPFQEVAQHAAAEKPDLVIHVGDYLYREKHCTGVAGCPGGPAGDTLETWEADFFTPAKKLLLAAPWVFIRGNHEDCSRAGEGWFTLLDPRVIKACTNYTEPYELKTHVTPPLVVLDSNPAMDGPCKVSDAACTAEFTKQIATYTQAFETISTWNLQHAWLLTHRPVWSLKAGGPEGIQALNIVEETAWKKHRPKGVELLLAGHTHTFEMIGFDPRKERAMQLVVGNGGTKLAPKLTYNPSASAVQDAKIKDFREVQDFGYTTLKPAAKGWNVLAHERDGKVDIACDIDSGKAHCQPAR
jgi:hypothetical protein